MKPLLSRKVVRGAAVNEWTPAEHHLTHDGQVEFMARMQARIKAAQAPSAPNVRTINRKGAK
jgi:hypothetical protein